MKIETHCPPAVETTYYGPTNTRGACIRGRYCDRRRSLPYRSELSSEENHRAVALQLLVAEDMADPAKILVSCHLPGDKNRMAHAAYFPE